MRFAMPFLFVGCSFAMTSRVPIPPQEQPDCTTSLAPPGVDVALALGTLIGGFRFTGHIAEQTEDGSQALTWFVFSSVISGTILFGASAYVGATRPARCKEARALWARSPEPAVPPTPGEVVPEVPLVEVIQARDPLAAQLTLQAHRAALRKDCAGVGAVSARVRELDAKYFAEVFVVDPAIASCR